jgi:sRNA-binding protein
MVEGAARIDLDGDAAGVVSKSAADRAANILKRVFKASTACAPPRPP